MNGSVALASDPRGAGHTARDAAAAASDACGLLPSLCWPLARLGVALDTLADASGLAAPTGSPDAAPPSAHQDLAQARRWLDWAAARRGLEVEDVLTPVNDLEALLVQAAPALLPVCTGAGAPGLLVLLRAGRRHVELIAPDGERRRCAIAALRDALAWRHEAQRVPEIDRLMARADMAASRRARVRSALLHERLADVRERPWWLLRLPPTAPPQALARHAGLWQQLAALLLTAALGYAGEIAAWGLVGHGVLAGRLEPGWLVAWLLMLATLLPLQLLGGQLNGVFARRAAALLKARLLAGALRLDIDRVRRQGVGMLLGRVIESQALESLALGGGLTTLLSLVELACAAGVLAWGAAPGAHLALLVTWLVGVAVLCVRFGRRLSDWVLARLALTHELIEQMVGHRTRLAQEHEARRARFEDEGLLGYLSRSRRVDAALLPLQALLPSGWLIAALALLVPAFVAGTAGPASLAVSLGGILMAQRAFGGISAGLAQLARAGIAGHQVAELLQAARDREQTRSPRFVESLDAPPRAEPPAGTARHGATGPHARATGASTAPLLEAHGVVFAHAGGAPLLRGLDLRIEAGDQLLLQGPSGGGKSTLGALLTGLRQPQSGQLRLRGHTAQALGDEWQALATAAPQFHENHVLSGTLAFNLLMGRQWPPEPAVLEEAQVLCEALGLDDLLQRMPAGLQQRIGETGWQLSHGERSRLFLARALLQRAPLTVLDESFAALDPETLARCLQCAQQRAQSLVVIAHP